MDATQRRPASDDEIDRALALLDRAEDVRSRPSRGAHVVLGVALVAAMSILAALYITLRVEGTPRPVTFGSRSHAWTTDGSTDRGGLDPQ